MTPGNICLIIAQLWKWFSNIKKNNSSKEKCLVQVMILLCILYWHSFFFVFVLFGLEIEKYE